MFRVSLVYIILWFLFQLLVDCQMIPKQRLRHTATNIDNKLYILGGVYSTNTDVHINDFFYLDVSGTFNTKKLPWQDLSNNTIPAHSEAATVVGGANGNTLILYGGSTDDATMALVYTFDPIGKTWSIPNVTGDTRKQNMIGINNNGKMYIWGGALKGGTSTNSTLILDTINFNFSNGSLINAPSARYNYGAVLLSSKNTIYYLGGFNGSREFSLNEIYLYDTNSDTWNTQETTGNQISGRDGLSAVLGLDGQRIIIFGGSADLESAPLVYGDSLYVLNLNNYEWSIPTVSGDIPKTSRQYHTANVIGKYMVISFGYGYEQSNESDILLLDISNDNNYIWTHDFNLSATPPPSSPARLIGAIIGSLFGGVLFSFGGLFLYKWYKKNKQKIIRVPSSNSNKEERNYNDNEQEISMNNQESIIVQIPTSSFNYGSEENLSSHTNSILVNDLKNEIKQEIIQDLRKEIIKNSNLVEK